MAARVGVEEYGYAAPDPLDPDIVYGGKNHALRPPHRPGLERLPARRRGPAPPTCSRPPHHAGRLLAGRPAHRCFFGTNVLWKTIDGGQAGRRSVPTSRARRWTSRRASASIATSRTAARPTQRRGVIYTIAPSPHGHQPHLGRHRRRPHHDHRRRRPALDRRHAAAARPLDEGLHDRRRPLRRRSLRTPPSIRCASTTQPAPLPHPRRRQDVDRDRQRHPRRRRRRRRPRRPQAKGPPLRRTERKSTSRSTMAITGSRSA